MGWFILEGIVRWGDYTLVDRSQIDAVDEDGLPLCTGSFQPGFLGKLRVN